jgi:hypothetical protein
MVFEIIVITLLAIIAGLSFVGLAAVGNLYVLVGNIDDANNARDTEIAEILIDSQRRHFEVVDDTLNELKFEQHAGYNYQCSVLENLALKQGIDLNGPNFNSRPFDRSFKRSVAEPQ